MTADLERTCWAGLELSHPAGWEISHASGKIRSGRLVFIERIDQRLDIQWRQLKRTPDIGWAMERFRRKAAAKASIRELTKSAKYWHGLVLTNPDKSVVVRAGRYFRDRKVLVELTLAFPAGRNDKQLKAMLESIDLQDPKAAKRRWSAFGICIDVGGNFEIVRTSFKVGRVRWDFQAGSSELIVERLGAPEQWLSDPLKKWLTDQLPPRGKVLQAELIQLGDHEADAVHWRGRASMGASLIGRKRLGLDVGWLCPAEGRVYRLRYAELTRAEKISLPKNFDIHCTAEPAPTEKKR